MPIPAGVAIVARLHVVAHLALNADTKGLVNAALLDKLKPGLPPGAEIVTRMRDPARYTWPS